jgi:hypothetical protein
MREIRDKKIVIWTKASWSFQKKISGEGNKNNENVQ